MDARTGLFISALWLLAHGSILPQVKRPEYLKLCVRSDPKINECLKNRFQDLIPHLLTGEPEVDLPSLQKVRLGDVDFKRELTLNANAGISLGFSFLHDAASAEVKGVSADISDSKVKMDVDVVWPILHIEGYFRSNLGLNKLTLINEGTFNLSLVDVSAKMSVTGKTYEKNGLKFLQLQHIRMRPNIGEMNLQAKNQGDGYSTVVDVGAAIINKYWSVLYSEYAPYIEDKWDVSMTEFVNRVISNVPYSHLFPNQ